MKEAAGHSRMIARPGEKNDRLDPALTYPIAV